jgi:hydrogenase maturation protease
MLLIAIGNPLRRDDGVGHRVIDLLGQMPAIRTLRALQLSPEIAAEFASAGDVVFIDADVQPGESRLEEVSCGGARMRLGHSTGAAEVVAFARMLFGFQGGAYVCRVPGADFGSGEGLSPEAEKNARSAARRLRDWLDVRGRT